MSRKKINDDFRFQSDPLNRLDPFQEVRTRPHRRVERPCWIRLAAPSTRQEMRRGWVGKRRKKWNFILKKIKIKGIKPKS